MKLQVLEFMNAFVFLLVFIASSASTEVQPMHEKRTSITGNGAANSSEIGASRRTSPPLKPSLYAVSTASPVQGHVSAPSASTLRVPVKTRAVHTSFNKSGDELAQATDARAINDSSTPQRLTVTIPQKENDSELVSASPHLEEPPARNLRASRQAATPVVDHSAAQPTTQSIKVTMPEAKHVEPDKSPKAAPPSKVATMAMPAAQHTVADAVRAQTSAGSSAAPEHGVANSVEVAKVARPSQAAAGQAHLAVAGGPQTTHFLVEAYESVDGTAVPNSTFHDPCSCEFKGLCSCQASIEFMDCVAAACNSDKCDCKATQFQHACSSIAGVCTSLDFQCSPDRASCLVEREAQLRHVNSTSKESIYEQLRDLKERRCRLELAAEDGWINAESRLIPIREETDDLVQELQRRRVPLPEMHCEKHFEEWHYPEPMPSRSCQATTQSVFVLLLVSAVLIHTGAQQ